MEGSAELEISRHLESEELLIWSGRPKQGIILRGSDAFMIPFSIFWSGFAVFWVAGVFTQGASLFWVLFGGLFVLIGLHFMVGRFFLDSRVRANTFYGLTNRRVIILSGILSRSITSLPLRTLHDLSLRERADGRGTILFGRSHPHVGWYAGMQWPGMSAYETQSFELIEHSKRVHDQILDAQRAAG